MSKLIEKEGKFYKECRLVFFNTEESAKFKELSVTPHDKLELSNFKGRNTYNDRIELYILSEESIQPNDWHEEFYSPHRILQNTTKEILDSRFGNKVIASTDPSLGLPQPSEKFIQVYIDAYNKDKKIAKVLVEYGYQEHIKEGTIVEIASPFKHYHIGDQITIRDYCHLDTSSVSVIIGGLKLYGETGAIKLIGKHLEPKLKDNNIIIKKVKNSWSREEVKQLFEAHDRYINTLFNVSHLKQYTVQWIEENI